MSIAQEGGAAFSFLRSWLAAPKWATISGAASARHE
jgi:hypothetical protein